MLGSTFVGSRLRNDQESRSKVRAGRWRWDRSRVAKVLHPSLATLVEDQAPSVGVDARPFSIPPTLGVRPWLQWLTATGAHRCFPSDGGVAAVARLHPSSRTGSARRDEPHEWQRDRSEQQTDDEPDRELSTAPFAKPPADVRDGGDRQDIPRTLPIRCRARTCHRRQAPRLRGRTRPRVSRSGAGTSPRLRWTHSPRSLCRAGSQQVALRGRTSTSPRRVFAPAPQRSTAASRRRTTVADLWPWTMGSSWRAPSRP